MPIDLRETVTDPDTGNSRTGNLFESELAVQTVGSSEIMENRAVLEGELTTFTPDAFVDSDAEVLFYYAEQGNAVDSNEVSAGTLGSTGTFTTEVTGLTQETTYEFQAAVRIDNDEATGSVQTLTTGLFTITTTAATNVTDAEAKLNGEFTEVSGLDANDYTPSFEYRETGTGSFTETTLTVNFSDPSPGDSFFLNIDALSGGTEYEFRAKVEGLGETEEGGLLTFITENIGVTTLSPTGVEAQEATLEGDITEIQGPTSVDYRFDWGTSGNLSNSTNSTTTSNTGQVSETITNLDADTTYDYELVVTSPNATYNGGTAQFQTEDAAVSTASATGTTSGSATLNGNVDALASGFNTIDVGFEYREAGTTNSFTTLDAGTLGGVNNFSASISAGTLSENTQYEFRATGAVGGNTFQGSLETFTTLDETVAVDTVAATQLGATQATLNGDVTTYDNVESANGFFEYGQTSGSVDDNSTTTQSINNTGGFSETVTGLSAGTDYEFRAVVDTLQTETTGSAVGFTTDAVAVSTNAATNVGTGSADLEGSIDELESGQSADVQFDWGIDGNNLPNTTSTTTGLSTGLFDETITSLTPGETYEFRATGTEPNSGDTDQGSVMTFTLDDLQVSTNSVSVISDTDIDFTGEITVNEDGGSADVGVEYQQTGQSGFNNSTSAGTVSGTGTFSGTITGLTAGIEYEVRAFAELDTGRVTGSTQTVTTLEVGVTTDAATTINVGSATLNGTLDALGASENDAAVSFDWGLSSGSVDDNNVTADQSPVSPAPASFDTEITGLDPDTEYQFRAQATGNPSGDVAEGSTLTFTTDNVAVSTTTNVTSVTTSSFTVEGDLTTFTGDNDVTIGHEYVTSGGSFSSNGTDVTSSSSPTQSTGTFTTDITGLSSGTSYDYRAFVEVDGVRINGTTETTSTNS